jgi:hypothetical protein
MRQERSPYPPVLVVVPTGKERAIAVPGDVTDDGKIHIIVNNAGYTWEG